MHKIAMCAKYDHINSWQHIIFMLCGHIWPVIHIYTIWHIIWA